MSYQDGPKKYKLKLLDLVKIPKNVTINKLISDTFYCYSMAKNTLTPPHPQNDHKSNLYHGIKRFFVF